MISIIQAMQDRKLFGPWFKGDTWRSWFAFLAALFGLEMEEQEAETFRKHTARTSVPRTPARECWVIVGRRGGKSLVAALTAVYLACFKKYDAYLGPGEVATVMVIAADRKQARVVMRYVSGFLDSIPMLSGLITGRTQEMIELNNRVVIEIHSCNFRAVRGYTIAAVICDEVSFWRSDESANPDKEVIAALRPALSTIPGSLLLCISSPYARRGALWEAFKRHHGVDGDPVLVWKADTLSMNPSVDPSVIERAYEEDETAASAEYGAEFRRDLESFVAREAVDACRIPDRIELPFAPRTRYVGFVDPSGGSQDSYTLAIAHEQDGLGVLDCVRERKPPFSPEEATAEFAELLKSYHIFQVQGDRYAGEWPREQFRKHGIEYDPTGVAKSDIYRELLPALNSGRVELLDNRRLIAQLCNLERRTSRGGRDSIDHAPGGHDDLINAAAGALTKALNQGSQIFTELNETTHNLDRHIHPSDEYKWAEFCRPLKKVSALNHASTTTAFLMIGIDFDGFFYALAEYCRSNLLIRDHAFAIRNLIAVYGEQSYTLLDPGVEESQNTSETSSIRDAYLREKVGAYEAFKASVGVGIDLVNQYLRIDPSRCTNLKLEDNNGRASFIGASYSITNLRNILMSRPGPPSRHKKARVRHRRTVWS